MKLNILHNYHKFLLLSLLLLLHFTTIAQQTKVRGTVTDVETGETLPYVNVQFIGTSIGTITDLSGTFFLQARTDADSIIISFIGFRAQKYKLNKGEYQEINVLLAPEDNFLNEVVVKAGENPAWPIMRNIINNKNNNDIERLQAYEYEVYNKMEIDINNVKEALKNKKMLKNFDFVFDYIETSAETGKEYLPVFITESLSDYYYQSKPKRKKEIIKASRISGVKSDGLEQFTGQMYIDINLYDNYVDIFKKSFVSPLNDNWNLFYKYYLVDSAYMDGHHCYLVSFKPQRKQELTFHGEFWVADTTWAIKKIKARIADDANLNYVDDFIVQLEFEEVDSSFWFLKREELFVDFNLSDKSTGFFGRKTTTRKNIKLNDKHPNGFFSKTEPQESITANDALEKDTTFWSQSRHETLSQKEEKIYAMVDSIKEVPIFKGITNIIYMLSVGYYDFGTWEWGPYFKTYSNNPIEGHRFRFGGRTSEELSTKAQLETHVAYGTKDKKVKYGGSLLYILKEKPRRTLEISHKNDIEQLGLSTGAFTEDNILSTLLRRQPNNMLQMVQETQFEYQHEWFQGFSTNFDFKRRNIEATQFIPFAKASTDKSWDNLETFEITLETRLAFNEKFIGGKFNRYSLGSQYPIISLALTTGLNNVLGSDYPYYRTRLKLDQHFNLAPFGSFQYSIQAGKVFGDVPFLLLKLHEGNSTYSFDKYAFNLMNVYEFASDTYVSFHTEHHFNGFFLNKIPLLRKLKLREIAYAKGLIGQISDNNSKANALFDFPTTLGTVNKPYYEVGVGLENIFKLLRLDAIWRLSYLDRPNASPFGIRASIKITL